MQIFCNLLKSLQTYFQLNNLVTKKVINWTLDNFTKYCLILVKIEWYTIYKCILRILIWSKPVLQKCFSRKWIPCSTAIYLHNRLVAINLDEQRVISTLNLILHLAQRLKSLELLARIWNHFFSTIYKADCSEYFCKSRLKLFSGTPYI